MTEKHAYPKCKICGGWHRGVEHEFGTKSTVSPIGEKADTPKSDALGKVAGRSNSASVAPERQQKAEGADAPKPPTAAPSATLSELGALADAASARIAAKPKGKRGRPANGFDKKAHDRQKAAERRAKAKVSI